MHKSQTKRALLTSVLALVLCVAMFASSTYAWFTDTASTGINKITSGNLDVKLEYSKDCANWADAEGATNIFSASKWEPGYTEVVYFKVTNAGSLAFDYVVSTNIAKETAGVNQKGESFKLSEFLKYDIITAGAKFESREAARAAVETPNAFTAVVKDEAILEAGDEITFAMVVWMPEETGDVANHNGKDIPEIQFGVSVVAHQAVAEKDSYDKYYDVMAEYDPETVVEVTPENVNETLKVAQTGKVYKLAAGEYDLTQIHPDRSTEAGGVALIGEPGVIFNGDLTLGYHIGQQTCLGNVVVSGITVKGDLKVVSKGNKTVVENCTVDALAVVTFGEDTVIDVKENVIGSANADGITNGYALYIVPEETYTLNVTNNTFEGCTSHCIAVQGSGQGGTNTSANGITVSGNAFNKWGTNSNKESRAAFKIWRDDIYAPNSSDTLNEAMSTLADKIIKNNTFEGYTTNSVYIDAYDAVKGKD